MTGCQIGTPTVEKKQEIETAQEVVSNDSEKEKSQQYQKQEDVPAIKPLSKEDYRLTDGEMVVALDDLYDSLTLEITEQFHLRDDDTTGVVYAHYAVETLGFGMIINNVGYDLLNEPAGTYYVEQLDIGDPTYKTPRGITLGSTKEEVEAVYGEGEDTSRYAYNCRSYSFQEMNMSIYYDENDKVENVIMGIERRESILNGHSESKYMPPDTRYILGEIYSHPTLGFEIDIPREWIDQYRIQTTETGVTFIHYPDEQEGMEILSFQIKGTEDECEELPEWPMTEIARKDGLVYSYSEPGESRYDLETEEGKVNEEAYEVLRGYNFKIVDHFRFGENAPKRDVKWYQETLKVIEEKQLEDTERIQKQIEGTWQIDTTAPQIAQLPYMEEDSKETYLKHLFTINEENEIYVSKVTSFDITSYLDIEIPPEQEENLWYILDSQYNSFYLIGEDLYFVDYGLPMKLEQSTAY